MKLHIHHPGRKTTIALFAVLFLVLGVMDIAYNRPARERRRAMGRYIFAHIREIYRH